MTPLLRVWSRRALTRLVARQLGLETAEADELLATAKGRLGERAVAVEGARFAVASYVPGAVLGRARRTRVAERFITLLLATPAHRVAYATGQPIDPECTGRIPA